MKFYANGKSVLTFMVNFSIKQKIQYTSKISYPLSLLTTTEILCKYSWTLYIAIKIDQNVQY